MITINEQPNTAEVSNRDGLLAERVQNDLADMLNEFGSNEFGSNDFGSGDADDRPARVDAEPRVSFGYGIPMAGVRYYSFSTEG